MTKDKTGYKKKTRDNRRARGFRQAGALIGPQLRTSAARRGFAQARLQALWPEIAGVDLMHICYPHKLTTARGPAGGILQLAVNSSHAPQVQMMLPILRERINATMGPGTVGRVQLTHKGLESLARRQLPTAPPAPPPRPELESDLARQLSNIGDDDLRSALKTLAENVIIRSQTPQKPER